MKRILAGAIAALTLGAIVVLWAASPTPAPALFEPTWESLKQYQAPAWYEDAKFGIFIHWGVYSVPAFGNEWYPRRMYQQFRTSPRGEVSDREEPAFKFHIGKFGPQSKFGYKDFIPMFKAEKFSPDQWAELFQKAGARYVVPVAEHHDGFAMYASTQTRWNAANMGPKRDVMGELGEAVRKRGMRLGASSHYAFNWRYYTCKDDFDTCDPNNYDLYHQPHPVDQQASPEFLDHWYARAKEIIDKYQPRVFWFDFCFNYPEFDEHRRRLTAYYYNQAQAWGEGVVLNYKTHVGTGYPDGTAVLDIERGKLDKMREMVWQTDTSISIRSWGYIENDEFRTPDSLVDDLVDIVSKNGVLLLNVGPKADGTIPEQAQSILLEIGKWLKVNGDAIYGTRPWKVFGEGPTEVAEGAFSERDNKVFTPQDIRFTRKGDTVYAIALAWPKEELVIRALRSGSPQESRKVAAVRLLGTNQNLKFSQDEGGLKIAPPAAAPSEYAHAFAVTFR